MGEESGNIESALGINLSSFTYKVNKSVERFRLFFTITGCYPEGWGLPRGLTPEK